MRILTATLARAACWHGAASPPIQPTEACSHLALRVRQAVTRCVRRSLLALLPVAQRQDRCVHAQIALSSMCAIHQPRLVPCCARAAHIVTSPDVLPPLSHGLLAKPPFKAWVQAYHEMLPCLASSVWTSVSQCALQMCALHVLLVACRLGCGCYV